MCSCFAIMYKFITKEDIMRKRLVIVFLLCCANTYGMSPKLNWEQAIDHAIVKYGLKQEPALKKMFQIAGVHYPPQEIALLAFKQEHYVELWAKNTDGSWHTIHHYPLTAYSGRLGPKLKEHDKQIPEGIYRLTMLNPFSSMHLSMMINYPNHFDRVQAIKDGRSRLGGDIFVHGKSMSVGCLAIGDKAIEQLFLLTRRVGIHHVQVIISPNDIRHAKPATNRFAQPIWLPELYRQIAQALHQFPQHKSSEIAKA